MHKKLTLILILILVLAQLCACGLQNPKQQLRQSFRRKRLRTNRTSQRAARRIGC